MLIKKLMNQLKGLAGLLVTTTLILAACQSATPAVTKEAVMETEMPLAAVAPPEAAIVPAPSVTVEDQEILAGKVTITEVVSNGPGWLVIHSQADGKPGPILGYSPVADGANAGVVVEIDEAKATETLYAMLHTDAGVIGQWEFPNGPDVPVKVDDKVVTPSFEVLAREITESAPIVLLGGNDQLGKFLTGANGMTLYLFTKDEFGVSNCYDKCAQNWPPLLLEDGQQLSAGEGVIGEIGTLERTDGGKQVTYNGLPLYYWIQDKAPGDATGQGVNGVWLVATPETVIFNIVPGESQVSYQVTETFLDNNRLNVAVGVTNQVSGKIFIDFTNPKSILVAPISVDINQFKSDSDRRDNKIRSDFLESDKYPIATFVPRIIEGLPQSYSDGQQLTLRMTGDLTVHDVTQSVTFDVTVQYSNSQLTGKATSTILMSDFEIGPISLLGFLNTEDEVLLTFDFIARP